MLVRAIPVVGACGLAAALVVATLHAAVRSGAYPDAWACDGGPLTAIVAATGAPSTPVLVLRGTGGSDVFAVPAFRVEACIRDEHEARRSRGEGELASMGSDAEAESSNLLMVGLTEYLDDRYSGTFAAGRTVTDWGRTGCAGCGGCADGMRQTGNPVRALGTAAEAAWDEKGRVFREAEEARMRRLLFAPQNRLNAVGEVFFAPGGAHERGLRDAMDSAFSRALDRDVRLDGSGLSPNPEVGPHQGVVSLNASALASAASVSSVAPVVAGIVAGEVAAAASDGAIMRAGASSLPPRLLRVGASGSGVVVSEIVASVVFTEVEELLYRGQVARDLMDAWTNESEAWRSGLLASYHDALEHEEEAVVAWAITLADAGGLRVEVGR